MKTTGIKYADLLRLADACRTSPGSEWVDVAALAAALGDQSNTTTIKTAAPDNLAAAIAQAKKHPTGKAKNLAELAEAFGVCRKTLDHWRKKYGITIRRYGLHPYNVNRVIEQLEQFTQK